MITQTDALGRRTYTQYDQLNRPITVTLNFEDGNPLTGPRDADIVQVTRYDALGRVSQTIDNYVDGVFVATEAITDRITLYEYDTLGRVVTTTVNLAPGQTDPALNRVTVTSYDPVTMRIQGWRDPLGRWASMGHDALGRVTHTTANCRDDAGNPVAIGCAAYTPTVRDQNVTDYTVYDVLGRSTDRYQNYRDGTYHTTATDEDIRTQTVYDGVGRVVKTVSSYQDGIYSSTTPDRDIVTTTTYDGLGRPTQVTDVLNATTQAGYNGLDQTVVVTDTMGRVTRMGYDGTGTQRWQTTPDGRLTLFQLDGLGRVVATIQNYQDGVSTAEEPDRDLITRTVYDVAGRRTRVVDAAGRVTVFTYDQRDRLTLVTENYLTTTCTGTDCNVQTQYQYDRADNRVRVIDGRGITTQQATYDAANQQRTWVDGLGRTTTFGYDALGRPTERQDPRGAANTVTYAYDGRDRLTTTTATNLGTLTQGYDALGRRLALTDSTGTTSFGYDALGRPTSLTAPNTGSVSYAYDGRSQRTSLTYPGGGTAINYTYRPDGHLATVAQGGTTLAAYTYDTMGRLDTVTRANGVISNYAYDEADRLTDLHHTSGGQTVSRFSYELDRLGLRHVVTETLGVDTGIGPTPTATPVGPTSTPTNTPVGPTSTSTALATATPTATSIPGTATPTATSVPATATPTATNAPATATPTATNTPAAGTGILIYDEGFSSAWHERWSWSATLNPAVSSPTYSGSLAYGVSYSGAWGAFRIMPTAGSADWSGSSSVRFALHGGATGGQQITVVLTTSAGTSHTLGTATAAAGSWSVVTFALPNTPNLSAVTELIWQEAAGVTSPELYLDRIELLPSGASATSTPTATSVPATMTPTATSAPATATPTATSAPATMTPTATSAPATATPTATSAPATATPTATSAPATATPTATSTPVAGAGILIYDEGFSSAWHERWSWSATLNPAVSSPTYSGSLAYGVSYSGAWGAFRIMPTAGSADWSGSSSVRFALHGGATGGQQITVVLTTSAGTSHTLGTATAAAGSWSVVTFALPNTPNLSAVTELIWQEAAGVTSPELYLDRIELLPSGASATSTPTATSVPATATPTATSAPATATPTATSAPATATPTATSAPATATPTATSTPVAGTGILIYDEGFSSAWHERWSWSATLNPAVSSPTYSGSLAYGVSYSGAWGAFRIMPTAGSADWSGSSSVRFALHGGATGGQQITVVLTTSAGTSHTLGTATAAAGSWSVVTFALPNTPNLSAVTELIWQEAAGGASPELYLDRIELLPAGTTGMGTSDTVAADQTLEPASITAERDHTVAQAGSAHRTAASRVYLPVVAAGGTALRTSDDSRLALHIQNGPTTRVITYSYDGLLRLTGATESPGTSYTYTYDRAGNRTDGGRTYDSANQVIGWTYDAAGNLLSDGSTTSTYDALSRLTSQAGTSYQYNGDGTLVARNDGSLTHYTQDLAAPLSQVLADGTASYVYGAGPERLRALHGPWYLSDALGSVRATLNDAGAPLATASYDPWGVPQSSSISPFGFTGELQDAQGLTYLRARWYDAGAGRFHSRDPFAGWPEQPYSQHSYQYAYSNPALWTDPTGRNPLLIGLVVVGVGAAVVTGGLELWASLNPERGAWWNGTPCACTSPETQLIPSMVALQDLPDQPLDVVPLA